MNENTVRWRVRCYGRVQHVGFRYTAFYLAKNLYLTGWVDNLPDGSVEMEVQGNVTQVRKLLLGLRGQAHIRITKTEIEELEPKRFERHFEVRGYDRE